MREHRQKGHFRHLVGRQNIPFHQHPVSQKHSTNGRVRQPGNANALQPFLRGKVLGCEAVYLVAFRFLGKSRQSQRTEKAKNQQKREKFCFHLYSSCKVVKGSLYQTGENMHQISECIKAANR